MNRSPSHWQKTDLIPIACIGVILFAYFLWSNRSRNRNDDLVSSVLSKLFQYRTPKEFILAAQKIRKAATGKPAINVAGQHSKAYRSIVVLSPDAKVRREILPTDWIPESADAIDLVAFVGKQKEKKVWGRYTTLDGVPTETYLSRWNYYRDLEIIDAATGDQVVKTRVFGADGPHRLSMQKESNKIQGKPVKPEFVTRYLKQFVAPSQGRKVFEHGHYYHNNQFHFVDTDYSFSFKYRTNIGQGGIMTRIPHSDPANVTQSDYVDGDFAFYSREQNKIAFVAHKPRYSLIVMDGETMEVDTLLSPDPNLKIKYSPTFSNDNRFVAYAGESFFTIYKFSEDLLSFRKAITVQLPRTDFEKTPRLLFSPDSKKLIAYCSKTMVAFETGDFREIAKIRTRSLIYKPTFVRNSRIIFQKYPRSDEGYPRPYWAYDFCIDWEFPLSLDWGFLNPIRINEERLCVANFNGTEFYMYNTNMEPTQYSFSGNSIAYHNSKIVCTLVEQGIEIRSAESGILIRAIHTRFPPVGATLLDDRTVAIEFPGLMQIWKIPPLTE